MSDYTYGALTNLGICAAITAAILVTGSVLPLIGLVFILTPRRSQDWDDSD